MDDLKAAHWLVERYGISVDYEKNDDEGDGHWRAHMGGAAHGFGATWIEAVLGFVDGAFRGYA